MVNKNVPHKPKGLYKPGDIMLINGKKLLVKRGHCDDCFFSRGNGVDKQYSCAAKFKNGCWGTLVANSIVILLKKGL